MLLKLCHIHVYRTSHSVASTIAAGRPKPLHNAIVWHTIQSKNMQCLVILPLQVCIPWKKKRYNHVYFFKFTTSDIDGFNCHLRQAAFQPDSGECRFKSHSSTYCLLLFVWGILRTKVPYTHSALHKPPKLSATSHIKF